MTQALYQNATMIIDRDSSIAIGLSKLEDFAKSALDMFGKLKAETLFPFFIVREGYPKIILIHDQSKVELKALLDFKTDLMHHKEIMESSQPENLPFRISHVATIKNEVNNKLMKNSHISSDLSRLAQMYAPVMGPNPYLPTASDFQKLSSMGVFVDYAKDEAPQLVTISKVFADWVVSVPAFEAPAINAYQRKGCRILSMDEIDTMTLGLPLEEFKPQQCIAQSRYLHAQLDI